MLIVRNRPQLKGQNTGVALAPAGWWGK